MREYRIGKAKPAAPQPPDPRDKRLRVELTNHGAEFYDQADDSGLPIARFGRLGLRVSFSSCCAPEFWRPIVRRAADFRYGAKYVAVDGNTYTWGGLTAASS